jgi:lipoprotein LprG
LCKGDAVNARTLVAPVVIALALGGLAGCGGGSKDSGKPKETPQQVLDAAKKELDATTGVHIELSTTDLPGGVTGISSADGVGTHPPAFEGTFKLSVKGLPADADVIAVDGKTYAKNSLLLPDWTEIDPADYGAPNPNDLMAADNGFSGLLSATTGLKLGKTVRGGKDNKEILTSYSGTVPAAAVESIIPTASGDFSVTYTVTSDDELREAVIKGVFYKGAGANTYDLVLDDYGTKKDIQAPS